MVYWVWKSHQMSSYFTISLGGFECEKVMYSFDNVLETLVDDSFIVSSVI